MHNLTKLTPKQSLNKAYLKEKVTRKNIELFKNNLIQFIDGINERESEEYVKNLVTKFLYDTYYNGKNQINTKGRIDLAIYEDKKPVVIIEAKRPSSPDMVSVDNLNTKAIHELMLYYLQERVEHGNIDIKYLIITNTYEWFVFDSSVFDGLFYKNVGLMKDFNDWKNGRKARTDRDLFYNDIAKPFLKSLNEEIKFTWFDLQQVAVFARNDNPKDDKNLIDIYKTLSPVNLLKQPFANDSNSLDKDFYSELLHLIGLEEKKDGGKKVIQRKEKPDPGSLLENTINILEAEDRLHKLSGNGSDFGEKKEDRLFNVALELCITWINRILFLKLLEGQLLNYHNGDKQYRFLDIKTIPTFDELNKLFFQVLARKLNERTGSAKEKFEYVPYLNSSLFDINRLEDDTLRINSLDDSATLKIHKSTVLKTESGKKREGELPVLQYLFEFLDAYDFKSEGKDEIQEENKTLINASVLGLIFEKINGYKDGSFFTPGFITMYMCRETIRRAAVQKFNETKGWKLDSFEQLYNKIEDINEANEIVNSLKICDPAVGSGHFLVSALNEIFAIKSDLGILCDRKGNRLREYSVEVVNDELIVSINEEEFFEYVPGNRESQRVQEALFHEKQTLIENCLFGVDINPNSVKICRLRLWIELLKNAYYTVESKYKELETLPNIDINIKQGNSLISRFPLDADLSKALKSIKYSIDQYRGFVNDYKNATDKEAKRGFEKLIEQIKKDFRTEIGKNDPKVQLLSKRGGELYNLLNQARVFEPTEKEKKEQTKKKEKLETEIKKLAVEIEEIKNSVIYKDAFEWRFEFPEVLDKEGKFIGFDLVIGNPPYIRQEELREAKKHLRDMYQVFSSTADLLVYFIERGMSLLKKFGQFSFIIANKFMRAGFGKPLRIYLQNYQIREIIDFNDLPVFEEATTYPCIISMIKKQNESSFKAIQMHELHSNDLSRFIYENAFDINQERLSPEIWNLVVEEIQVLIAKLKSSGISLGNYVAQEVYYGIKTGLNDAFVVSEEFRNSIEQENPRSLKILKPFLEGKDIKRYEVAKNKSYLILFQNGATTQHFGNISEQEALNKLRIEHPIILEHLEKFSIDAKRRSDQGEFWWELRPCDYYDKFETGKIIYPNICKQPEFTIDHSGAYTNQKCFIIPKEDKYLLGILNSSVTYFLFRNCLPKLRGGFYEPSYVYFKDFPIANVDDLERKMLEDLVDKVILFKKDHNVDETKKTEDKINQLVYRLYRLTEDEIKIIEGN